MNQPLKVQAKVKNGRLLVDEPTDLPEGTVLELIEEDPYAHLEENDELDDASRAELHASLKRGLAQMEAGIGKPADEVIARLRKL
jgi:hypothetical protein